MNTSRAGSRAHPLHAAEVLVALLFFAALGLGVFWPVVVGPKILFPLHTDQINPWRAESSPEHLSALAEHDNPLMSDKNFLFHPDNQVFIEALREHRLPLWNPYILGGAPFLGQSLYGVFYPPHWLLALMPAERAYGMMAALHLALAGFFTYVFLRRLGLGSPAALFGGVTFALSGPIFARLHYYMTYEAVVWLPLGLLAVEDGVRGRHRTSTMLVAPVVALMVLTGFPQTAVYCVYAMAVWAVVRARRRGLRAMVRSLVGLVLVVMLGLLLCSVEIVPYARAALHSGRSLHTFAELTRGGLSPNSFATLLVPDLFGNPTWAHDTLNYLKGAYLPVLRADNFTETAMYAGVVTIALAVACPLVGRGRGRFLLPALAAGGFALAWFGFGEPSTPWLESLLDRVMAFTGLAVGDTKRALLPATFFVAASAARALDGCLRSSRRWRLAVPTVLVFAAGGLLLEGLRTLRQARAAGLAAHLHQRIANIEGVGADFPRMDSALALEHYQYLTTALQTALLVATISAIVLLAATILKRRAWLAAILLTVVAAGDLLHFGLPLVQGQDPAGFLRPTPITDFLTGPGRGGRIVRYLPADSTPTPLRSPLASTVIVPNMGTHFHIEDANGYIVQVLDRYGELFEAFEPGVRQPVRVLPFAHVETLSSALLDLAAIRYVLTTQAIDLPGLVPAFEWQGYRIYENTNALDRVACFERVQPFRRLDLLTGEQRSAERRRLLATLTRRGFDPHETLIVEGDVSMPEPAAGSNSPLPEARLIEHRPEEVVVEVKPGRDAYLYLADSFYPGWDATVDGKPAEIVPANMAFRAVYLPAGSRKVRFTYRPGDWTAGLWITLNSLLIWAVALFLMARPRPPATESILSDVAPCAPATASPAP